MTAAGRAYFRYHFRSKWKILLCITVIALAITLSNSVDQRIPNNIYDDAGQVIGLRYYYLSTLETPFGVLSVCSCLFPVIEFAIFKKRRNLDCFYSLPISRKEMGIAHYITGWFCVVIPYSCAYVLNFLLMLRYPDGFHYRPLLGGYFLGMGMAFCIYSVYAFLFNRANTVFDGIIFILMGTFVITAAISAWNTLTLTVCQSLRPETVHYSEFYKMWQESYEMPYTEMTNPIGALLDVRVLLEGLVEKNDSNIFIRLKSRTEAIHDWRYVVWYALWGLVGIAAVFGFAFSFGKDRADKTGEVSDSWFGYKLMIPLYACIATIGSGGNGMFGIVIISFTAYIIYRRGFHLKQSNWLTWAGIISLNITVLSVNELIYVIVFGN